MMRRLKLLSEQWWLIGIIGGVLILFVAPWVARELSPLSSQSLFQEARAEIGASRHISWHGRSSANYVAALARAGGIQQAREFISSLPNEIKPLVLHDWLIALLDTGQLDEATRAAMQLQQMPNYKPHDSIVQHSNELVERLLSELIRAGRYEDALKHLAWLKATGGENSYRTWSNYLGQIAAEAGQLEITEQAALGIRTYSTPSEAYLLRRWLNANRTQEALEWLRRMPSDCEDTSALWVPLPTEYQQAATRVRALTQQGRTDEAAQLAEATLRRYLQSHTQRTADFGLLMRLSLQFGALLPPETMSRMLQRLPTQRYQCAETHLEVGYLYSLGRTGRWREVLAQLGDEDTSYTPYEMCYLLMAMALEQDRHDAALQLGKHITDPDLPYVWIDLFKAARFLLETGRADSARALMNFMQIPTTRARIQKALSKTQHSALSPELANALTLLVETDADGFYWFTLSVEKWRDSIDVVIFQTLMTANRNGYAALLQVIESLPNFRSDGYLRHQLTKNAWLQDFYDPSLANWLLQTPLEDWGVQQDIVCAAAAAAQAGQFDDAERLMQHAGRVSRDLYDVYQSGYAVGLARQGKFREAVRTARRIGVPEYRVYALANIAAELKKRGL